MITHKIKNILILVMAILLLISGTLNILQLNSAKREQIAAMLRNEQANTMIAANRAVIEQKDIAIATIRKSRAVDSTESIVQQNALKARVSKLVQKLHNLPKTIAYNPDSATVDSLRVAFVLKDSVIDTQALMITSLEVEKEGMFYSFNKEIGLLNEQRESQVDISNQLQNQLVDEQGKTRKSERWRKFWKRTTGTVVVAAAAVVTIVTLKE